MKAKSMRFSSTLSPRELKATTSTNSRIACICVERSIWTSSKDAWHLPENGENLISDE